jgi:hypothetical protein
LRRSVLVFESSDADGRARAKAATRTVGGRVGVERHRVVAFTTLRASTRRTGQTAYLRATFGRIKVAHPDLLFNVLRRNRVSMSWWVTRNWLTHTGRRWSAVLRHHTRRRWAHTIRRVAAGRRWAKIGSWASSVRLKRVAWRVATTAAHRRTGGARHATS